MISRVADHCFWLGRYLERTESAARLLQATRRLVFDADIPVTRCWQPLVIVSGAESSFVERHGAAGLGNGELVQNDMTWGRENFVSLVNSARAARECARAVREQLSLDTWEEINELYLWLGRSSTAKLYAENRDAFYRSVRRSTQLTLGVVRSTMLHDEPMTFLWLGVMIERAGQTPRILDMHHHTMEQEAAQTHDIVQVALWMSLLSACSGSEAFVRRVRGRVSAQSVVSFLMFERKFPRSVWYCLSTSKTLVERVWPEDAQSEEVTSLSRLNDLLAFLDGERKGFDVANIHALLTRVVDETSEVCSSVSQEILGPAHPASTPSAMRKSQTQTQAEPVEVAE
jgi:uncharacterized alpha-E superfamily protein